MNIKECLTVTKNTRFARRTSIETTTYELLSTSESGETRIIDVVEVEKIGRKKATYRYQIRRMSLPEGKYINDYKWDDTQPDKCKALVKEWLSLPVKDSYKARTGLTVFETFYLK